MSTAPAAAAMRGAWLDAWLAGHGSGVTVMGARWPLDSVEVPFGTSLTLSNEVRGDLNGVPFACGHRSVDVPVGGADEAHAFALPGKTNVPPSWEFPIDVPRGGHSLTTTSPTVALVTYALVLGRLADVQERGLGLALGDPVWIQADDRP